MRTATHVKYMLYAAASVFAVLAVAGVPLGTALTYGALLACPLMMVWMMVMTGGHDDGADGSTIDDGRPSRSDDSGAR